MISINNVNSAALLAIKKLASELRDTGYGIRRAASSKHSEVDLMTVGSASLIDVSELVEACHSRAARNDWDNEIAVLRIVLQRGLVSNRSKQQAFDIVDGSHSRKEAIRHLMRSSAWEKAITESVRRTVRFSSCMELKPDNFQRRDAFILSGPSAGKTQLISMFYLYNAAGVELPNARCTTSDDFSSVFLFSAKEEILRDAAEDISWHYDQDANWSGLNLSVFDERVDNSNAGYLVFLQELVIDESEASISDDWEPISSTRTRDLFYGKSSPKTYSASFSLSLERLKAWSGENLVLSREELYSWPEGLARGEIEKLDPGDTISSQRVASIFSGVSPTKPYLSLVFEGDLDAESSFHKRK